MLLKWLVRSVSAVVLAVLAGVVFFLFAPLVGALIMEGIHPGWIATQRAAAVRASDVDRVPATRVATRE